MYARTHTSTHVSWLVGHESLVRFPVGVIIREMEVEVEIDYIFWVIDGISACICMFVCMCAYVYVCMMCICVCVYIYI